MHITSYNHFHQHARSRPRHRDRSATIRSAAALPTWPALLNLAQVGAYLGMSPTTFIRHAGVPPVRLGARLLRWRRSDIDQWVESIKTRHGTSPHTPDHLHDTTARAIDRVLNRAKQMKAS